MPTARQFTYGGLGVLAAAGLLGSGIYIGRPTDSASQKASAEPGKPKFVSREDILPSGILYVTDNVDGRRRRELGSKYDKDNVLTVCGTDTKGRSYVIELDFPMSEKDFYKGAEDLATSRTKGEKFEVKWKDDHFRPRAGRPSHNINIVDGYEKDGKMVYILRVISPGFVQIVEESEFETDLKTPVDGKRRVSLKELRRINDTVPEYAERAGRESLEELKRQGREASAGSYIEHDEAADKWADQMKDEADAHYRDKRLEVARRTRGHFSESGKRSIETLGRVKDAMTQQVQ